MHGQSVLICSAQTDLMHAARTGRGIEQTSSDEGL